MNDGKQETVADIVAEMREFADTDSQSIGRDVLRIRIQRLARRIEQASTDCTQLGNAKAMREALNEIQLVCYKAGITIGYDVACGIIKSKSRAALSVPPRNCDVGTAEEQAERFYSFCKKFQSDIQGMCSSRCPCKECCDMCHCLIKWAQMPYEEGGAK